MLIAAFWILIAVWPVVYVCYPVGLLLIARLRNVPPEESNLPWPTVAILVAAHNEERTIEACIRSCLSQSYPGDPPKVVVGLDGCTDGTEDVLRGIHDARLHLIAFDRQGKAATDNALIAASDADVVAMTSAGAQYLPGTLQALVRPFRSARVGCTGGVFSPRRTQDGSVAAEASYFALEYRLMHAESDLGILSKVSGTALTFRRSLWRPIPLTSDADISLPCFVAMQGLLVVFVPGAVVIDDGPRDLRTVFRARRRMSTQGLANVPGHVVNLARSGHWGHAATLTFHKLLRWLAPVAALACAVDAVTLAALGYQGYAWLLVATALLGLLLLSVVSILRRLRMSVVASFLVSQLAFLAGAADWSRGSGVIQWER